MNNAIVIIPTYNEKENIIKLIDAIRSFNYPVDILVVDDNSPDDTGKTVEAMKSNRPNLEIIHREKKEGLGVAYIDAFRHVLKNERYDYVVQMDADFSHDPKYIHELLEKAKQFDVVVGSRYVKGGDVSQEWGPIRKLVSRFGNIYARIVTGLKLNDCTSGFKCYRKKALRSLDLNKRFLNGYGFQVQTLYELNRLGFRIYEIPIFFAERIKGTSKMSFDIVIEAFYSLILLRLGIIK